MSPSSTWFDPGGPISVLHGLDPAYAKIFIRLQTVTVFHMLFSEKLNKVHQFNLFQLTYFFVFRMTSADNTAISLDRSGDLTFSISNTVLNSKRHKTDGIPLAPVLRPNALKMVRTP